MVASMGMALVVIFWRGLMTITLALGFQPQTSAAFYPASFRLTSIPACRDAPCDETKRRYFEFKRIKICERIKNSIYFYFSCIIYLSRTLLTY